MARIAVTIAIQVIILQLVAHYDEVNGLSVPAASLNFKDGLAGNPNHKAEKIGEMRGNMEEKPKQGEDSRLDLVDELRKKVKEGTEQGKHLLHEMLDEAMGIRDELKERVKGKPKLVKDKLHGEAQGVNKELGESKDEIKKKIEQNIGWLDKIEKIVSEGK